VAEITNAENREELFQDVFRFLGEIDFTKTNPEIIGATFAILKKHIKNDDPYFETRNYYNKMFLDMLPTFEEQINQSKQPLELAIKYAIVANIIDFNPIHNNKLENVMHYFSGMDNNEFAIDHAAKLIKDVAYCKKLLYIGDNCGEICLDKLLIKKIKEYNNNIEIYFAVRGEAVVNDSIESDAYFVGIDEYAKVISNGDNSLGTVLSRTSREFNQIYQEADVIIAKGQANYESLSEQKDKNIFYLLITKCLVIANDIGIDKDSLVCMSSLLS
jgi:uncharacterized protein with ATP-grasp and redox domains